LYSFLDKNPRILEALIIKPPFVGLTKVIGKLSFVLIYSSKFFNEFLVFIILLFGVDTNGTLILILSQNLCLKICLLSFTEAPILLLGFIFLNFLVFNAVAFNFLAFFAFNAFNFFLLNFLNLNFL
tara:strand:+ start:4528 stop:4905 length:378 start_codon:yes stop_codon:yes gene_type:complete